MDTPSSSIVKKESIEWVVDWGELDVETVAPFPPQNQNTAAPVIPPEYAKNQYTSQPQSDTSNAVTEITTPVALPITPTAGPPPLPVPQMQQIPAVQTPAVTPIAVVNTPKIKELVKGERFDLSSVLTQNPHIKIELVSMSPNAVKLIALGLEASEILAGSEYCVGPRVPSSPCGAITHITSANNVQAIQLRAGILPKNIKRVEISVVSADPALPIGTGLVGFRLIASESVIVESRNLDPLCASSKCATILEIYERQGVWRLRMIGEVLAPDVQKLLALHGAKTS
jgi:stress response protein SCP2